jgi:hypothetical protein
MPKASTGELRRFGFTVGAAFAVLGTVAWWRGHALAAQPLWTVAGLLVVAAALAPVVLGPVQRGWLAFAHVLGEINTRIILGAIYYLMFAPFGAVRRRVHDPLARDFDDPRESFWVRREPEPLDPKSYERQF